MAEVAARQRTHHPAHRWPGTARLSQTAKSTGHWQQDGVLRSRPSTWPAWDSAWPGDARSRWSRT